jgi:hypothetical protein
MSLTFAVFFSLFSQRSTSIVMRFSTRETDKLFEIWYNFFRNVKFAIEAWPKNLAGT